jgi:hypothetical protein
MIDRLVILKVELIRPSVEALFPEFRGPLSHSFALKEGELLWATDDPGFPFIGSHLIYWVRTRSSAPAAFRTFVGPIIGDGAVQFLICGALIEPSTINLSPALSEQMLTSIEEIFTILRRNAILEETLHITDRGPMLHYVESMRYTLLPSDADESLPELISGCLADLNFCGRGFAWYNAARLNNVIAVPAGISTLRGDDIIIGQFHTPLDQDREHTDHRLQLPDKVQYVLLLKGLINCWKQRISHVLGSFEIVPARVAPMEIKSLDERVSLFAAHMKDRARWVNIYHEVLQQLRTIRQMTVVKVYMGDVAVIEPLPRRGVYFGNRYFFDDIRGTLRFLLEEMEDELSFRERLSIAEGDHLRQAFDFGVAQKNMELQKAVTWLTWILVILTLLLFLLTGLLALDSPTVRVWLKKV